MKLLFFDTETCNKQKTVVEVGWILVDSDYGMFPLCSGQFLLPGVPWEGTGIPPELTNSLSKECRSIGLQFFQSVMSQADIYVAHNYQFDAARVNSLFSMPAKASFCTCYDIDWASLGSTKRGLEHLCTMFGVERKNGHTALNDAQNVVDLVKMIPEDKFLDLVKERVEKLENFRLDAKPKEKESEPAPKIESSTANYRIWLNPVVTSDPACSVILQYAKLDDAKKQYYIELNDCTKEKLETIQNSEPRFRPPYASVETV